MKIKKFNFEIKSLIQFIKFSIVGVSNTIISLVTYYIFIYFNFNYLFANTIGFIIGVLNSYLWNRKYVFYYKKTNKLSEAKTIIKVFISYGITLLLSTGLLYLLVNKFQISNVIAPLINVLITTPINFLLNKYWVYKN